MHVATGLCSWDFRKWGSHLELPEEGVEVYQTPKGKRWYWHVATGLCSWDSPKWESHLEEEELDDAPEPRKCRLASATPNVSPPPPLGHLDQGKNYELAPLAGEQLETVLKMAAGEYEKSKILTVAAWSAAQLSKLVRDLEHGSEPQPEPR